MAMAVFLFHGQDTYSLNEKINRWKREFEKKYGDLNCAVVEGKNANPREIFQMCAAMPFLADKRLVIVKNFLSEAETERSGAMAELIEQVPDFCVLVFSETEEPDKRISLYKKLQKIATVTEFSPLAGSKLIAWIEKEVARRGARIEKEATITLANLAGGSDLYRLSNEIAKLAGFCAERPITVKDIELLVDTQFSTTIFKLTDGIGQKNRKFSIETLHHLIESGEELHRILYMIMRQMRIIACVKDFAASGLRQSEITTKLKEHPFVISNCLAQAKNYSFEQLKRAYKLLLKMDAKLKSGGIKVLAGDNREFVLALDRLVLDLCGK